MSQASSTVGTVSANTSPNTSLAMPTAIQQYFDTVNDKAFEQTAALFSEAGELVPPFEKPIQGKEAIAQYLTKEASDMTFHPSECTPAEEQTPDSHTFLVKGKVKNSLFSVNVGWQFDLNSAEEITFVKVKLLAKLEELLKLNR